MKKGEAVTIRVVSVRKGTVSKKRKDGWAEIDLEDGKLVILNLAIYEEKREDGTLILERIEGHTKKKEEENHEATTNSTSDDADSAKPRRRRTRGSSKAGASSTTGVH